MWFSEAATKEMGSLRAQLDLLATENKRLGVALASTQEQRLAIGKMLDAAIEERKEVQAALSASEQRYHELVLKAMAPAPGARIESAAPQAEDRARHAVSLETKFRAAEHLIAEAAKKGHTIDYAKAFAEAETMIDHPEYISLET